MILRYTFDMYSRSFVFLLPLFFFVFFTTIFFSHAQQFGGYDAYDVLVSDQNPSPGVSVDFSIQSKKSLSSNIRSVRWLVDGVERGSYANKLTFTEVSGDSPKQIVANIHYFDVFGELRYIKVSRWIRPVIFDILWEADSVVTPMYRGHRLAGPSVPIRISANMRYTNQNGFRYTEKDFSFRWMIESRYYGDRGPGVSSIVYTEGGDYFNRHLFVQVEATLVSDSRIVFERMINIPITEPRLLVYPHTLFFGLSRDTVIPASFSSGDEPVTASIYPFYFSQADFDKNTIQYRWFVNNSTSQPKEGRKLNISARGSGAEIPVRVFAYNENEDLQQSDTIITFHL